MIGFYNYTVILTYVGVCFGMLGIYAAAYGDIRGAMICLLASGFCDLFDGRIARTKQRTDQEKRFGIQIDSLADLVDFGALPAVIGFQLGLEGFRAFLLCLYVLAALIRLAYFNVQEIMRSEEDGKRTHYTGLPVTAAAIVMPVFALLHAIPFVKTLYVYPLSMLLVSFLFVSRLKVKKPYGKALGVMALIGVGILVLVILFGGEISGGN